MLLLEMTYPNLFKDAASYYHRYRRGYPKEFYDRVVEYFALDGRGRLLDLGCGTGQITIPFAKYFEEAIGVDPDPDMIREAEEACKSAGVQNITWVNKKAEEISGELGIFRLTTMGKSFHWMDQARVLKKVYEITESGGGVVIVSDSTSVWREVPNQEKWKVAVKELIKKYLGEKRRAGDSYYQESRKRYEDYLKESLFQD